MHCFTMPTAHLATTVLHPNLKPQHFHSAPFQKEKHRLPIYPSTKTDTAATASEYASYQQWLTERNETRYQGTQAHGQGYDAKI